jgi:4-hydroxy-3-polyprenylbenzoate decarboxylase
MPFHDLREFISFLEKRNLLVRIKAEVDPKLEVTEILNRLLAKKGPAVIFENVKGSHIPVVANLFGTVERAAMALDTTPDGLTEIGDFLASVKQPKPPKGIVEAIKKLPFYKHMLSLTPKTVRHGECQEVVLEGDEIDLTKFPILHCWPEDAAPLITWPLVITKGPQGEPFNVGVYRMQVIDKNRTIMRWLSHRGGAQHYREWMKLNKPMPVAVAIGADPGTILAAVTPVPEDISEFHFAGLYRKKALELVPCKTVDLKVPASSEIILEGEIYPGEFAPEGPYGDHTGYYNPAEPFPVFRVKCITHRKSPLYLTTVTGRPPREDAVIGVALNKIFVPLLRQSFPEVVDFTLPMEAVSYRIAVVSIKKGYPGHAKRIMMGLWGFLKQFLYVKYIIVVDPDIDVNNWNDVIWAISTRADPSRDITIINDTPIDYLDFASPKDELGGKMGIDATNKIGSETTREWGTTLEMSQDIIEKVTKRWKELGLG